MTETNQLRWYQFVLDYDRGYHRLNEIMPQHITKQKLMNT